MPRRWSPATAFRRRLLPALLCAAAAGSAAAQDAAQDLKRQLLELNRDLLVLEEQALYPPPRQLVVFVGTDAGVFFEPESVKLEVDGRELLQHRYSAAEAAALAKGGTQQLYLGTLASGPHELLAVFEGPGPRGRRWRRAVALEFEQPAGAPRLIELHVGDSDNRQQPEFTARVWR